MPWPWTNSIHAASTLERRADRCTHRTTKATRGWPSPRICPKRCLWRSSRSSERVTTIRLILPAHLRKLAGVDGELVLPVHGPVIQRTVLAALEARYTVSRGTIREHAGTERRSIVPFFAGKENVARQA